MRAAITRQQMAFVVIGVGLVGAFGCFRDTSLVDPSGPAGYRAPDSHVSVITLAPTSVSGAAGAHVQISATPQDQSGHPVAASGVTWVSSNPQIATVSGTGMVTLLHKGRVTITAIADGVTASLGAVITPAPPASISVTLGDSTLIQAGQHAQLTAAAFDATGAVDSGVAIDWASSNPGVASVSSSGMVTANAVGTATIEASASEASVASSVLAMANAARTATVTASSTGAKRKVKIHVTSSTLVVSSVAVSPGSSSLYPGGTEQLTATLKDSSGNVLSGIAVSWATSSGGVASVSSSGVVSAVAIGSATMTATAGGQSGTAAVTVTPPAVASVSVSPTSATLAPGQTTQLAATARDASGTVLSVSSSWTSSDASVASVSSSGLVTGNAIGSATVTATAGGVAGTAAVTVESGPPGGFHEPTGMAPQINTGAISALPSGFSVFSPSTPTSYGEWSGNLTIVPGGTGLRLIYQTNLWGGYSPVRFGVGIPSAGTGWYYQRMKVRFSPNWTLSGNVGVKLCEPRTQQTGSGQDATENHVISVHDFETQSTHAFFMVLLQGPNGQARDLFEQPQYNPAADLNNGAWRTVEVVLTPESSPGAGDGTYTGWVDGTQIAHYTNVQWLAAGNQVGWPYLMFDPTYGGGTHSPVQTMYWDVDQIYVSTK